MAGFILLITLTALLILSVVTTIAAMQHKAIKRKLLTIAVIVVCYGAIWIFCYMKAGFNRVELGTDVCFDDWCATITGADVKDGGSTIVLHVTMSNHARGIAQKPDDPRIHLIDDMGNKYAAVKTWDIPLDARLQLNESRQTTLIFQIPQNTKKVNALIEEGPFIAGLVFPENQQIFEIR